jgi:tetratricopeptide (TPR) repeat protein
MKKKVKIKAKNKANQPPTKIKNLEPAKDRAFLLWLLGVLAITGLCLIPMLNNGFTNWDDDVYVTSNSIIKVPDWQAIFTRPSAYNYHPLTMLTLAFNYAISGMDPFSYHLVNWLLHILNTSLVFLFIYKISGRRIFVAAFTSLIFGIHPMHVESVAWVSERKDVLYTCFFLPALLQYWNFLESAKRSKLLYCFTFFILSLLSKPAAIILPFVLLLLDYWHGRSFTWKVWAEKIPFLIFSLLFGFITIKVQSAEAIVGFDTYPLWTRFFFACYTIMIYTTKFIVPYPLSAFHPYPSVDSLGLPVLLSPVFMIAIMILLWLKRKDKLVVFSVLFFIVNLLLVMQFVSIGLTIVSERYTYVPYIGLCFLVGMWLSKYLDSKSASFIKASPFIITIIFGIISFQRTKVWKDGDTLWTDVVKHYPDAATPRSNHADYLRKMAALPVYISRRDELLNKALEESSMAIKLKPTHIKAYVNRQNIYLVLGKDSLAMTDAETLLKLEPSNSQAFYTKGFAYMRFDREDSSLFWFNKSIEADPNADFVLNSRGTLLFNKFKRYDEAIADFTRAIGLNPKGEYFYNRSNCYFRMGDVAKAKSDALIALQKGYVIPEAYKSSLQL